MAEENQNIVDLVENIKNQWVRLIDAIIDPIMIVDKSYTVLKANKSMAKFAGKLKVKEVLNKKCHEVFASSDTPCKGCKVLDAFEKSDPISFELSGMVSNRHYEVTSQPLTNEKGITDGVVQVYRDRTEAKNLHKQLIQSEKLASIGLLAGGIAHEINNPLGGILIFSQMLMRELDKESPHYQDIVEIESATQRCKEIVDRLLDFARQQPGDVTKSKDPIPLSEVIATAMRFAQVSKNAKKCEVFYEWEDEKSETSGDRNRFIQVFLNLFQNAFQAMADGGTLTIVQKSTIEDGEAFHLFEVRDTGHGVASHNLDHIFEPFFTTKEPGEGTGLGLAICYGILKELGGELSVKSEINEGTSFFLKLPVYTEPEEPQGLKEVE
jgi:two-component system, NtrC family, sensor kinase